VDPSIRLQQAQQKQAQIPALDEFSFCVGLRQIDLQLGETVAAPFQIPAARAE
jgi:hypothetical protein